MQPSHPPRFNRPLLAESRHLISTNGMSILIIWKLIRSLKGKEIWKTVLIKISGLLSHF